MTWKTFFAILTKIWHSLTRCVAFYKRFFKTRVTKWTAEAAAPCSLAHSVAEQSSGGLVVATGSRMDNGQRERDALFGPASSQRAGAGAPSVASAPTDGSSRASRGRGGGEGAGGGGGASRDARPSFDRPREGDDPSNRWDDGAAVGGVCTEHGTYTSRDRSGISNFGASQQQHQPLSWEQARAKIDVAGRQRGLRSAYESVEIGRTTLEGLDDQRGGVIIYCGSISIV